VRAYEAKHPITNEELRRKDKKGKTATPREEDLRREVAVIPKTNIEIVLPQQPRASQSSNED
jgi:hypothetical protein